MRIARLLPAFALTALLALPGCKPNPRDVTDQIKVLKKSKSDKQKLRAVENLANIGTQEALDQMIALLQKTPPPSPQVIAAMAKIFGETKTTAAVDALCEAIDQSVGSGSDRATQDANTANKEIARALGEEKSASSEKVAKKARP
jgi:HEAT repeat protein